MNVYLAIYGYLYPQSKFIVKCGMKFCEHLYIVNVYCKICYLYIGNDNFFLQREMLFIRHKR